MASIAKLRGVVPKISASCLYNPKKKNMFTSCSLDSCLSARAFHGKSYPARVGAIRFPSANPKSRRTPYFQQKNIRKLIEESRSFLKEDPDLTLGISQRRSLQIFSDWYHVLFRIPYTETALLKDCAVCIDGLVHSFLDGCHSRTQSNKTVHNKAVDFVCTGIYAWGRVAPLNSDAPKKAEVLLTKLLDAFERSGQNVSFRATENVYSALAYSWSQADDNDAAPERAHHWLNVVIEDPNMEVQPATFNAVLRAYARRGRVQEVTQLVETMPTEKDAYTYETLIQAWLHSDLPDGPSMAYKALQEGIQAGLRNEDIVSLTQLFGRFLNMNRDDPTLCEKTLNQMLLLQEEQPSLEIVETRHFVICMTSWASIGETRNVEKLFRLLENIHKNGNERVKPTFQVLCVVLSAFTKKKELRYLQQAEQLLKLIEDLFISLSSEEPVGNHAYNMILDAYARTSGIDNKEKIQATMQRMQELSEIHGNSGLMPDKVSYASLIRAIAREGKPNSLSEIEKIIREMESSSQQSMQPDLKIYALVLDAMSKSGDSTAVVKAEGLLARLKYRFARRESLVRPDVVMCTILMKIFSKAGLVKRSDSVLTTMDQEYEEGNIRCRPNEMAFITAMGTWERSERSDAFDGALRLFHNMRVQYRKGNADCKPTVKTFGQLMVILAHSNHPSKQKTGYTLLRSMQEFDVEADRMVLNWYLRVCATSTGTDQERNDSFVAATEVFESLQSSKTGADSNNYTSMLCACVNLLDSVEERRSRISEFFQKCVHEGRVDHKVLMTLRRFLTSEEYQELTSLDADYSSLDMKKVPQSWHRNVK